jgi:hypothetical protein
MLEHVGAVVSHLLLCPSTDPEHARVVAGALLPALASALWRVVNAISSATARAQPDVPPYRPVNLAQATEAAASCLVDSDAAARLIFKAAPDLAHALEHLLASEDLAQGRVSVVRCCPDSPAWQQDWPQQAVARRLCKRLREAEARLQDEQLPNGQQPEGPPQEEQLQLSEEQGQQPPAHAAPALAPACAGCGVTEAAGSGVRLRLCRGCRRVRFCGEACMRRHWASHRPACEAAQEAAAQQRDSDAAAAR